MPRRVVVLGSLAAAMLCSFALGVLQARRADDAARSRYRDEIEALRSELRGEIGRTQAGEPPAAAGTAGRVADHVDSRGAATPGIDPHATIVAEVKEQLRSELGLLPLALLRDRRASFVELYATDNFGKTNYGTAGYLGHGYFITGKHAVVALKDDDDPSQLRRVTSIRIVDRGRDVAVRLVDAGNADVEVHSGDWAIVRTEKELELPALNLDPSFDYEFAEPIFRFGNDYSKGILLSTGYVGQRTPNGLVTCLTDGHPGVSGGGVLNRRGDLVGIPIGRMQGDYRFSFILPIRSEMLRKVPGYGASSSSSARRTITPEPAR
ncbi:MAG TPA: serine protease [Vicinamibacterales bacterium]